jgi:hypothetical protein
MTTETDILRQQYALAYSESLPPDNPSKKQPHQSAESYTTWWCTEFSRQMVKIVRVANEALYHLSKGYEMPVVQLQAFRSVRADGAMTAPALLAECVPPLQQLLVNPAVDADTFEKTMHQIVKAFAPSEG